MRKIVAGNVRVLQITTLIRKIVNYDLEKRNSDKLILFGGKGFELKIDINIMSLTTL